MPDNRKKPITSKCCREVVTNKTQTQNKNDTENNAQKLKPQTLTQQNQ
jgi:hypothetical protein